MKHWKHLTFLSCMYTICMLVSILMMHKVISVPIVKFCSAGVFIIPLTFIIIDITTEVYGYKSTKKLLWSSIISLAFFCFFSAILIQLPSPISTHCWKNSVDQPAYNFVFSHIIRNYFSILVALAIGSWLNAYIIAKWRILVQGRYFWLRSVGSSCIGEFFFTFLGIILVMVGANSFTSILKVIAFSFLIKVIFNIIFATPAVFVIRLLRASEKIDPHEQELIDNPFK